MTCCSPMSRSFRASKVFLNEFVLTESDNTDWKMIILSPDNQCVPDSDDADVSAVADFCCLSASFGGDRRQFDKMSKMTTSNVLFYPTDVQFTITNKKIERFNYEKVGTGTCQEVKLDDLDSEQ